MGGTPILGYGREVRQCLTPFFNPIGSFFMYHHDLIDILFLQNTNGLSLSHLVPEILGPKVGLIFHQNVLKVFKYFVSIFSLMFDPIDPLFH